MYLLPLKADDTSPGLREANDRTNGGRLPHPVPAEERHYGPTLDLQRNPLKDIAFPIIGMNIKKP